MVIQFFLLVKQRCIVWDNLNHSHKQLVCYILINASFYEDIEMLQPEQHKVWPSATTDLLDSSFFFDLEMQLTALPHIPL